MKRPPILMIMVLALGGCGGDDDSAANPQVACERLVDVLCSKYYECLTEGERDFFGLPETEAACATQFEETYGCAEVTLDNVCEGSETYQASVAEECLDQLSEASCGQLRDGYDAEEDAPSCAEGEYCQAE